ncbi:MAG TPA: AAA family ATPase [Candidatus Solibacter sp.]|nr:AAA family ATPase [Candidatus Solibacter sp.]
MHLKSVQIQGFKTFAKKTELLFEPGITAVVGPNGSGKSNLVDAIRWVLGERSARELRGTRMEEIVYSGGSRRAASGMAEVKLLIDNSDGRLPVPFAEVEVIRRGYRSGESDYWMNGSRCRLRDIEEMFASTGLTQQGYAVVAQDDVDHIIQTTASDRRALIEEAAGVRGLRSKRQEAIAKLKDADVSILRLGDIASELGPRVEELRRQAEAAREHEELTARLATLRGSLLQGEWRQARLAVKKATARLESMAAAVAAAEADALGFATIYEAEKEKLARAHDARLESERRLGGLRLAATHAASKAELVAERLLTARTAASQAEAAETEAAARLEALGAELAAAEADVAALADLPAGAVPGQASAAGPDAVTAAVERHSALQGDLNDLTEAHQRAAAQVQRLEERVSLLRRLAQDGDIPALSARRLVQLLEIGAVREAATSAGIAAATLTEWAEQGRVEQAALAAAGAAAEAELDAARTGAEQAWGRLEAGRQAAGAAAADLDAARRAQMEAVAESRAIQGRATAVRERATRARTMLDRQREEAERARALLITARESAARLEAESTSANDEAAATAAALEAAPIAAEAVEVEALTRALVDMEKGHLERQVVLAHQREAQSNAVAQLEVDNQALAELTERMGGASDELEGVEVDWEKTQREINRLDRQLTQMGPVNELAISEYDRDGARLTAISGQLEDLTRAREGLERIAAELGAEIDRRFEAVFGAVAFNFQDTFASLFVGGKATLKLDDPESPEPGVEILAQPAGKRMRNIKLLSGGERALTALAFILALEKVTPSPFYIFDEVDAPLDDANIGRFTALLESMAADNQFILITHNHATMTVAQALYGVTLEDSGVSRVVSVRLRAGEVIAITGTA